MKELIPLPCPFCGCKVEAKPCWPDNQENQGWYIHHPVNKCLLSWEDFCDEFTEKEAIKKWNKRKK